MRFHLARADARFDGRGEIVLLRDQDRSTWDHARIQDAVRIVSRFLRMRRSGSYQLQALIAMAHAEAPSWDRTRWPDILRAYDALLDLGDSPVVRLNRAIALWHVRGARGALDEVDQLRAELLRALGRTDEARRADRRALELTENPAERALLERRLRA